MRVLAAAAALAVSLFAQPALAKDIGQWSVTVMKDRQATDGCLAVGPKRNGTTFAVRVDHAFQWSIVLENKSWKLPVNEQTQLSVSVDGSLIKEGLATNISATVLVLPIEGSGRFRAIKRATEAEVMAPEGELIIGIDGIGPAMTEILDCVRLFNREPPAVAQQQEQPQQGQRAQTVSAAETTVMLTNLLNAAGVQGYRLSPPQANAVGTEYSLPDGTMGSFQAFRSASISEVEDQVGFMIGQLSQTCKGDFRSAKTSVPTSDGSLVRKIGTTCTDGGSAVATTTTIVRHADGFVVQLLEIAPYRTDRLPDAPQDDRRLLDAAMQLPDVQR